MKDIKEIELIAESVENSQIRADLWGDFVDWENRWQEGNRFLLPILKKHGVQKVLDVALGDGVDTVLLLKQGFSVQSNEVDEAFREKALENAKKRGFEINPTDHDWRNLSEGYEEESVDAVICLGNSMTLLFSEEDRLKALDEFKRVLKKGGVLIVDTRNFQKLKSTGKNVYAGGDIVKAQLELHNDDSWIISYSVPGESRRAYYKGYPFKKGEFKGLLEKAGFSRLDQYSDYELGDNPEADFYQFVCVK